MRIAWFLPSGVAQEDSQQHIPALTALARGLSREVPLTVFSFSNDRTSRTFSADNAIVHFLPVSPSDPSPKRAYALVKVYLSEQGKKRFDLIHGFWALPCGALAAALGRLSNIPSVVTFLGGESAALQGIGYGNLRSSIPRAVTLWTARHSSHVHFLTGFQRSGFPLSRDAISRETVLPFGVDTARFHPRAKRRTSTLHAIHVANITEVKDQETLLRSFRVILNQTKAHLRIIGPDFMNGKLQNLSNELGLAGHVDFFGFVPNRDLPKHYAWADVYLQTSMHEGQGVSVLEAMAAGVVVCGTNVGLLADMPEACCFTASPQDPDALAQIVLKVAGNAALFDRTRRAAARWAKNNDLEVTVSRLLNLYKTEISHE